MPQKCFLRNEYFPGDNKSLTLSAPRAPFFCAGTMNRNDVRLLTSAATPFMESRKGLGSADFTIGIAGLFVDVVDRVIQNELNILAKSQPREGFFMRSEQVEILGRAKLNADALCVGMLLNG